MRAIWNGEIAFGLVAVPVKLYSATKDLTPRFHLIHSECGTRIQMKRWCPKDDIEVPWEEIEKGYEVSKGRYAKFTKEEIEELEGEDAAEGIDIAEFIEPTDVDLAMIEKSYWVGPAGKTTRSYELLRNAMEKSGKVALARVRIRTRTRLALLRPRDGRFSLDMIRFGDELVPANDIEIPSGKAGRGAGKELDLALDLIDRMTGSFDPVKHPDDYRKAVLKAVEQKEEHEELAEDVEAEEARDTRRGKVVDLAEMLSRSLGGTKKHRAVTKRAPAHAARTARTKKGSRARTPKKTAKRKAARR